MTRSKHKPSFRRDHASLRQSFEEHRHRPQRDFEQVKQILRKFILGVTAVGCGASFLGLLGSLAGVMWSLAIQHSPGIGALYGGLGVFAFGAVVIPLNSRIGTTLPLGLISVALLLLLTALGAAFWLIGLALQ